MAELAASAVVDALEPQSVLALSNGNAVAAVVNALPARSLGSVYIAQMIGSLSPENPMVDSPELCRRVAEKFGCSYQIIPAPSLSNRRAWPPPCARSRPSQRRWRWPAMPTWPSSAWEPPTPAPLIASSTAY